jgi:hypothetical protein
MATIEQPSSGAVGRTFAKFGDKTVRVSGANRLCFSEEHGRLPLDGPE